MHVLSGELAATFSRERTALDIPEASRVPLIRIPHPLLPSDRVPFGKEIDKLNADGFNTVFVFAGLIATGIEAEFAAFDPSGLLFLRNVRQMELRGDIDTLVTIRRENQAPGVRSLRLASVEGSFQWTIMERDDIALGFVHDPTGIVRLDERRAVVHAFLPTLEASGFSFKLNGDISTDPSRTRVVLDDRTSGAINVAAAFIVDLVRECVFSSGDIRLLAALVPIADPRMAGLQRRSFRTELYSAIQRYAANHWDDLYLRPTWLNAVDFYAVATKAGLRVVPRNLEATEGLRVFLRFLGAREANFQNIAPALVTLAPSESGAAEVVAHLTTLLSTRQIAPGNLKSAWKLWPTGIRPESLETALRHGTPLASTFVDQVREKVRSSGEVVRLLTAMSNEASAIRLLGEWGPPRKVGAVGQQTTRSTAGPVSLKKWRSAEQQVLDILASRGWQVKDVSRENIGYDIEGRTDQGESMAIEVKLIDYVGQSFTLTTNEEAVARQMGAKYHLAVVRQTQSHLEIAFIPDPTDRLTLTRQCRQWVWECSGYDYVPEQYPFE